MSFQIEWKTVRRTLARPLRTARGPMRERVSVLVRLTDASGASGYGEACPLEAFGTESVETVENRLKALGDCPDVDALGGVEATLPCTRFAVETAMVDLRGLRYLPPVRHRSLPVCGLADLWTPFSGEVARLLESGFTTLKFKVGVEGVGRELARVEALLPLLAPDVQLRLDANGAFSRADAEAFLQESAKWPIEFLEQPLAPDDIEGLVQLSKRFPGRVAVEESVSRTRDLALLARAGWEGPVVVKPSLLGTVVLWADAWARYSWPWVFSSALETRIGASHALGIAFALSREPRAVGFGISDWLPDDGLGGGVSGPLIEWQTTAGWSHRETWEAAG
jgi:o-succinylbenzoate synthase